jgi:predicted transposase YdaD
MPKPFDATTRYLLEAHPDAWPRYFGLPSAWPVGVINADLSTITAEADKVLRIGAPEPWLLHVELQSSYDRILPRRLLRYNVLLDLRHDLPVQSVAVLLRPGADGADLTGTLRRRLPEGDVFHEFRYRVIRAWQQPVEQVLEGGLGALPLAPLADVSEATLPGVLRRMHERLRREASPPDAAMLWTATYLLMGLRYPREVATQLLQGVRGMRDSVTYQAILEEGKAEGIAQGKAEGEAKGMTVEAKRILLRMGQKRFGPPGEAIVAAIGGITDREQAEALTERLLDVSSWDELLAPPTPR